MIQWFKNLLKRFLPPPTRAFNREVERILLEIRKEERDSIALLCEEIKKQEENTIALLMEEISRQEKNTVALLMEEISRQEKNTVALLMEENEKLKDKVSEISKNIQNIKQDQKNAHRNMLWMKEQLLSMEVEIAYLVSVTIRESAIDHGRFQKVYRYNKENFDNLNNYDWLSKLTPDKYNIALISWYYQRVGEWLDLENPITINEKIQWLKLYDSTPLKTQLTDKYLAREWIADQIGDEYLIPLIGVWEKFNEIDFDKLPNQFVLKANHGSGYNLVVKDKTKINIKDIENKFNNWLQYNYAFNHGFELQYLNISARIIAEIYLENLEFHTEYQVACSYGQIIAIWVGGDRKFTNTRVRDQSKLVFDEDWNLLPVKLRVENSEVVPDKPQNFDKILKISRQLSLNMALVRIDFYEIDQVLYVGELTFTSSSGTSRTTPRKYEKIWGDMIQLPSKSEIPVRIHDNLIKSKENTNE